MTERSFAPADRPPTAPRQPDERPAIVRRYLWRDPPTDSTPPAADRAAAPQAPRP